MKQLSDIRYNQSANGQVERMYVKLNGLAGKTIHNFYNRLGEPIQAQYQPGVSDSHYLWYTYDQRNQLTSAIYNFWNGSSWQNPTSYNVSGITYDRDGILGALTHRREVCSANTYGYSYASGSNRLTGAGKTK